MENIKSLKNILVPIDFSPVSINALQFAMILSRKTAANIKVLNAIHTPAKIAEHTGAISFQFTEKYKKDTQQRYNQLKETIPGLKEMGASFSISLEDAKDAILEASSKNTDLIVMGSKEKITFEDVIFGNKVMHVIEKAKCSVLVIPKNFLYEQSIDFITVLLGESLAKNKKTITIAKKIADILDAELNILNLFKLEESDLNTYLEKSGTDSNDFSGDFSENKLDDYIEERNLPNRIKLIAISDTSNPFFTKIYDKKISKFIRHNSIPLLITNPCG